MPQKLQKEAKSQKDEMDQSIPESSWQRIDSGKKLTWFTLDISSLKWQKSSLFQLQTG